VDRNKTVTQSLDFRVTAGLDGDSSAHSGGILYLFQRHSVLTLERSDTFILTFN